MSWLDTLSKAWIYRGEYCVGDGGVNGEVIVTLTTKRQLAVCHGGYRRLSGALLKEGDVGLIQPEVGHPVLVKREKTENRDFLVEL